MTTQSAEVRPSTFREVVLGCGSKVWRELARDETIVQRFAHAIGHRDLDGFRFTSADRVWVLSYSRDPAENQIIFQRLASAGVREVVYVSSSSTIVSQRTTCYEYPRVKQLAETDVLRLPHARVLTIGLVYTRAAALPAGENIATSHAELAGFMLAPAWTNDGSRRTQLFRRVSVPFAHPIEARLFRFYGSLMGLAGAYPCLLRPVDMILRFLRIRWYGYVYLSNHLWISTMS